MKVTKKDKFLLIILAILLIGFVYYKYVFLVQMSMLSGLEKEKSNLETKKKNINLYTISSKNKEKEIKVLNSKIGDKTIKLFPKIEQEKIIIELDDMLNTTKLEGYSLTFSEPAVQSVETKSQVKEEKEDSYPLKDLVDQYNTINVSKDNKESSKDNSKKTSQDSKPSNNKISNSSAEEMTVNINFKGSYGNVLDFISTLENYSKKIIISNINLTQDLNDCVSGTVVLEFYAIPKINDEDKEFMEWKFNDKYGKDNPFDGSPVNFTGTSLEQMGKNNTAAVNDYDFVMIARSINSDLPAIMLGKSKDSDKKTYVYADNDSVENVEICFTQKDGKYFYKYKIGKDTYPVQYEGNGVEFIPESGGINFKVYSNKRISDSDSSGANIKIYNKTDKEVNVSIDTDDEVKPRISVSGDGGNVNVKRN